MLKYNTKTKDIRPKTHHVRETYNDDNKCWTTVAVLQNGGRRDRRLNWRATATYIILAGGKGLTATY